jgi:small subunit ribosomal protein S16
MSVVIRLMRAGAKKRPFYRMVAADSRRQRDGRFLEILGHYNPIKQPFELVVHKDKVEAWLSQGAQPSEQAASLLRSAGVVFGTGATKSKKAAGGEKQAKTRGVPRKVSPRKVRARVARKAARIASKAEPVVAAKSEEPAEA